MREKPGTVGGKAGEVWLLVAGRGLRARQAMVHEPGDQGDLVHVALAIGDFAGGTFGAGIRRASRRAPCWQGWLVTTEGAPPLEERVDRAAWFVTHLSRFRDSCGNCAVTASICR